MFCSFSFCLVNEMKRRYNYILYPLLLIIIIKEGKDNQMKEKLSKLVNVYKKYGFIGFCKKLRAYIIANYLDKISFKVMFNKKKYNNKNNTCFHALFLL